MAPVKHHSSAKDGPFRARLSVLLDVFSPWEGITLSYRQFAAELGSPVTEGAVKKWPHRKQLAPDVARLIVRRAHERGLAGVTLEWVLWGEGPRPQRAQQISAPSRAPDQGLQAPRPAPGSGPHSPRAVRIAEALAADLSHNEFGEWSSLEVQRTVIWGLKDLARRLRVHQLQMGKTFELTDEWAAEIGLPVRLPEPPPDEGDRAP